MHINNIPYTQLIANPGNFAPNNPPAVPNIAVHALPPQVQQFLVPISAAVANKLSHIVMTGPHGAPHPGRIYVFNAAAANAYQNPFFGHLVAAALDVMFWHLMRNPSMHPEQAMMQAADSAVTVEVSKVLVQVPQMSTMVDQMIIREAMGILQSFEQMNIELMNMKNRSMPHAGVGHTQYGGSAPMNTTMYGETHRFQQNPAHNPGVNTGMNNPMYGTPGNTGQPINTPVTQTGRQLPAYLAERQHAPVQTAQVAKPVVMQILTLDQWRPSNLQIYPPAYRDATQKAELVEGVDPVLTQPCYLIKIVQKDGQEMERSQHQLSPIARTHQTAVNSALMKSGSNMEAQLSEGLTQAVKALPEYTGSRTAITTAISPTDKVSLATSFEEAVFETQYKLQKQWRTSTLFKAYTNIVVLNKPFVAPHSFRTIVDKITDCKKLSEVVGVLEQALEFEPDESSLTQFVETMDRFLTKEFNNYMATRLAISTSKLGSFMEDANAIIPHLRKKRGDMYADILEDSQEAFIKSLINESFVQEESHAFVTSAVIPSSDDEAEQVDQAEAERLADSILTHIPQTISMTVVGVKSADLDIGTLPDTANLITSEAFPALSKFARNLFRALGENKSDIAHHYLVTQDLVVFELSEGIVSPNTILIMRRDDLSAM